MVARPLGFGRVAWWREAAWMRRVLQGAVVVGVLLVAHLATSLVLLARVPEVSLERIQRPPGKAGTLLVCGGGRLPESVRARFVQLAGGPAARIVVIPTAGEWSDRPGVEHAADSWRALGVRSARVLHTRNRAVADSPAFVAALREATGVWIGGGHQTRLADAYGGTAVETALHDLLARGGVVGGTSAGAGIMSRLMIVKGRGEAVVSRGFGLVSDVVIDQHFLRRNRVRRLLGVLATHPGHVGLGVDEATALEVDLGTRRLRAIGESYAVACVPASPGGVEPPSIEVLKPGDEADLAALRAGSPNAVLSAIEVDGL